MICHAPSANGLAPAKLKIFVTTERVIIETSEERVSGSALQRYDECCIEEEHLEQRTHRFDPNLFVAIVVLGMFGIIGLLVFSLIGRERRIK